MTKSALFCLAAWGLLVALGAALPGPAQALDTEGCLDCHSGQIWWSQAPDVSLYWGGTGPGQDGGHGDEGNLPSLDCVGTMGCHDVTNARTHRNGILEGFGRPSWNTFHLKEMFLPEVTVLPPGPSSAAETFNTACAEACHVMYGISPCAGPGHSCGSDIPYTPVFGQGLTPEDADGILTPRLVTALVDSDITTLASRRNPDFGLCVSCHDPHGTGVREPARPLNNHMVRLSWVTESDLCFSCHINSSAPSIDSSRRTGR